MLVEVETLGKGGSTRRMLRYEPSASCESSLIYAIDFADKQNIQYQFRGPKRINRKDTCITKTGHESINAYESNGRLVFALCSVKVDSGKMVYVV